MNLRNAGMKAANDVSVSVKADGVRFINFSSQPFLSTHFRAISGTAFQTGQAILEIDVLPPDSQLNVTGYINTLKSGPYPILKVSMFSKESNGYGIIHTNIIFTVIVVFSIGASVAIAALWYRYQYRKEIKEYDYKIKFVR
jgi:hypothetical protein